MEALFFEFDSLDLIWFEGVIYNIGFECGIWEWWVFFKIGGYLVVLEIIWFM